LTAANWLAKRVAVGVSSPPVICLSTEKEVRAHRYKHQHLPPPIYTTSAAASTMNIPFLLIMPEGPNVRIPYVITDQECRLTQYYMNGFAFTADNTGGKQ